MGKIKIAIIRGGQQIDSRRNRSITAGANILLTGINNQDVILSDIHIDEKGKWLHDGKVKSSLESLPFHDYYLDTTGIGDRIKGLHHELFRTPFRSKSDINRVLAMRDVPIPRYIVLRYDVNNNIIANESHYTKIMYNLWRIMHIPIVISSDNKNYTSILTSNYKDALEHIMYLFSRQSDVIISEYKEGDTYTLTTMPDYRGEKFYVPIVHKVLKKKYNLSSPTLARHDLDKENLDILIKSVSKAHSELNIDHPIQWDVVIQNKNKFESHIVKINIVPDFHPESKFIKSINSTGVSIIDMLKVYADKMSHI